MSTEDLRQTAAQAAYEAYDFGASVIEDHSGWERVVPSDEWSRTIFLKSLTEGEPTERGHFVVRFESGTAVVKEAYGMLDGEILRPVTASSPR